MQGTDTKLTRAPVRKKTGFIAWLRWFAEQSAVAASDLFDADWYLAEHPEVRARGLEPAWHYVHEGWRNGYDPGPRFNAEQYCAQCPSACARDQSPLYQYLRRPSYLVGFEPKAPGSAHFAWEPKVSIVVASYNYAAFLGAALDSLLVQTYAPFEILVVDDGSSDGSLRIINDYCRRDPRVKLLQHPAGVNRGLPATLRLGLENAGGDYIAFCESDDLWEPDHLAAKIAVLNRHPEAVLISCGFVPFGDPARCAAVAQLSQELEDGLAEGANWISALQWRLRNWIPTFSCAMVRRAELLACDFDSPRPENLDWWLWRQVGCGQALHMIRRRLVRWRMHVSYMSSCGVESLLRQGEFLTRMDGLLTARHPQATQDLIEWWAARSGPLPVEGGPFFSIIMPSYNRCTCIGRAIDSVLSQTYRNFELIIADDGSSDGTCELLEARYGRELAQGRFRILPGAHQGVSAARNRALAAARGVWIAYLDTDNEWLPDFLECFVREILACPERQAFNARLVCTASARAIGAPFEARRLLCSNYMDLGVFVHRRELLARVGGFDEEMTRLVDWDFIYRLGRLAEPGFVNRIVLRYDDSKAVNSRVSNVENLRRNLDRFRSKHGGGEVMVVDRANPFTVVLPYGLVVSLHRYTKGWHEDEPLFYYASWKKTLRRCLKFVLPYGLVVANKRSRGLI